MHQTACNKQLRPVDTPSGALRQAVRQGQQSSGNPRASGCMQRMHGMGGQHSTAHGMGGQHSKKQGKTIVPSVL